MPVAKAVRADLERASWIRRMFEEGRRLREADPDSPVYDFSLGNPDLEPPEALLDALRELVADTAKGTHAYMPNVGYREAREAIARKVSREHAFPVGWSDVVMTVGAAGGLNVLLHAILDPGDEVIVVRPWFAEYRFYINKHGGRMVEADAGPGFTLDVEAIRRALSLRTKALILNSPNNPTGRIYPRADLEALAAVLVAHGGATGVFPTLIVDEPYRDLAYEGVEVPPVMDAYPETVVCSSFSKSLSVPGERIGYLAVSSRCSEKALLMDALAMGMRTLGFVNAPALMQRVVARVADRKADIDSYARRRSLLLEAVRGAGLAFAPPEGAFYLFCEVPPRGPKGRENDAARAAAAGSATGGAVAAESADIAFALFLKEFRVLAVPGSGFGMSGWVRLSYAVDEALIRGVAPVLKAALEQWRE
ncbi:MAG: pyridoxal phosphate-dependent aminotransferase [Spirochaetales bacterium]|nr:pyridoxal phosphate-dependent aminotransferase [Spirochaetales bacterium]